MIKTMGEKKCRKCGWIGTHSRYCSKRNGKYDKHSTIMTTNKKDCVNPSIFRRFWNLLDRMGIIMTREEYRFLRSCRR